MNNNNKLMKKVGIYSTWNIMKSEYNCHKIILSHLDPILEQEDRQLNDFLKDMIAEGVDVEEEIYYREKELSFLKSTYLNSLFINNFSWLEGSMYFFCEKYCAKELKTVSKYIDIGEGKKIRKSLIRYYKDVIEERTGKRLQNKLSSFYRIDDSYRHLRTALVHFKFLVNSKNKTKVKDLKYLNFQKMGFLYSEERVMIEDKLLNKDFLKCSYDILEELFFILGDTLSKE